MQKLNVNRMYVIITKFSLGSDFHRASDYRNIETDNRRTLIAQFENTI